MASSSRSSRSALGLSDLSTLVYSTEAGRHCARCSAPLAACRCLELAAQASRVAGDGVVRVSRESKGRGGKTVTVVRGVPLDDVGLSALAKELKTACGSGGTLKDGVLEVQGDHVELLMRRLAGRGWTLKRSGG